MLESQSCGMQKISRQGYTSFVLASHLAGRPIQRIAYHSVPDRSQVYTDLMRAPGVDLYIQQRELSILRNDSPQNGVVSDRLPSSRELRRHTRPPHPIPADAAADRPPLLLHPAMYQRDIG